MRDSTSAIERPKSNLDVPDDLLRLLLHLLGVRASACALEAAVAAEFGRGLVGGSLCHHEGCMHIHILGLACSGSLP